MEVRAQGVTRSRLLARRQAGWQCCLAGQRLQQGWDSCEVGDAVLVEGGQQPAGVCDNRVWQDDGVHSCSQQRPHSEEPWREDIRDLTGSLEGRLDIQVFQNTWCVHLGHAQADQNDGATDDLSLMAALR